MDYTGLTLATFLSQQCGARRWLFAVPHDCTLVRGQPDPSLVSGTMASERGTVLLAVAVATGERFRCINTERLALPHVFPHPLAHHGAGDRVNKLRFLARRCRGSGVGPLDRASRA